MRPPARLLEEPETLNPQEPIQKPQWKPLEETPEKEKKKKRTAVEASAAWYQRTPLELRVSGFGAVRASVFKV